MARMISTSMLWAAIYLQLTFFIILSALYIYKDKSPTSSHVQGCPAHCNSYTRPTVPAGSKLKRLSAVHTSHQRLRPMNNRRPPRPRGKELHTLEYEYTINPASKVCSRPVYLLVIVESTTYNAMERDYFRNRWKVEEHNNKKIATVFVTANSGVKSAQELLKHEYKTFGDILQIGFEDSYRNLTLKTMLSLRWAVDECQPFEYIMKTDDDMIINFDVLINQLESLPKNLTKDLYTGVMMSGKPPIRDLSDKWHVTLEEYPDDKYPDYMGGPGYVLSYGAANKIIEASYQVNFMPMEDVFVGICAEKAGVVGYSNLRFSNWEIWDYYNYCWAREMTILHKADFAVRELYYYDRFINKHKFDFKSWERKDIFKSIWFAQQKVDENNDSPEFIGYPTVYECSPFTWEMEKEKCLHKHTTSWQIPLHKIIDI